jgi:hypothetical protein
MSFTYATLRQTNPAYDPGLIRTLSDLYVGGFQVMRRAEEYLVEMPGEGAERFQHRIKCATYQPYFGQIVDQFASDLFARTFEVTPAADAKDESTPGTDVEVKVDPFYVLLAKDADGLGHSFVDVARDVLTTALVHRRGVLAVDAPEKPADADPKTKADEEALGLDRYYAYELPVECLIDWEHDDDGDLLFAVVRKVEQRRTAPGESRAKITESFTVWTIDDDGKATWERFAVSYTEDKKPKDEDEVPRVAGPVATNFDAIPLHVFELPDGLWVGGKIGPNVIEHFRRRSALIGAQNASLCAIPVAALGSEYGAPGKEPVGDNQTNPHRGNDPVAQFNGKGFVVTGEKDKIYFAEPAGSSYELVDRELKELRDDIFAVAHQMAASVRTNSTALGRSGASKNADQSSTAKVLSALGRIVRSLSISVFSCISTARGDDVEWAAHGLDNYESEERPDLIDEALAISAITIPSPTFKKLHAFRLVQRLVPNATSQEYDAMRQEIDDGIDDAEEIKAVEADARKAAAEAAAEASENDEPPPPGASPSRNTGSKGPPNDKGEPPTKKPEASAPDA